MERSTLGRFPDDLKTDGFVFPIAEQKDAHPSVVTVPGPEQKQFVSFG